MELSAQKSKINFNAFLWHSAFLALASNFMDVDTIIPSMLIKAGGNAIHLGILTAISLVLTDLQYIYQFIFIFSGMFIAVYKVAVNGVLLEISNNENRAVYAGISGAGNIATTLFPLFAGVFISVLGYTLVYLSVTVIVLSSYFFVTKLKCKPVNL
jgi:hypothetical protein